MVQGSVWVLARVLAWVLVGWGFGCRFGCWSVVQGSVRVLVGSGVCSSVAACVGSGVGSGVVSGVEVGAVARSLKVCKKPITCTWGRAKTPQVVRTEVGSGRSYIFGQVFPLLGHSSTTDASIRYSNILKTGATRHPRSY